jgi:hypothetical protein
VPPCDVSSFASFTRPYTPTAAALGLDPATPLAGAFPCAHRATPGYGRPHVAPLLHVMGAV